MRYKILDINKPNINGIIYPKEIIEKSINSNIIKEYLANGGLPVFKLTEYDIINTASDFDMQKCIGFATEFDLSDTDLHVSVKFINDYKPDKIFPFAYGTASFKDGKCIVEEYELVTLYIKEE